VTGNIDVKELVSRAIRSEWPAFAEAHPRLASVLDESLIIDRASENLAEDPEYQAALAEAAAAGMMAEAVGDFVTKFVTRWLRRLV
jgi:hypothetical protein